jgi:pyrimidine operon attenuation protein/uracil phosphoribosyltransferase
MNANTILTNSQINHIINRIAYQIYETFEDESQIVIAGISVNGFIFAKKIQTVLMKISSIDVQICEVFIDKSNPSSAVNTSLNKEAYANLGLVLVDDVLNSGTTLVYAMRHFLDVPLKKFKTAVLVDRNHKKYPIKVDFKGISLSTSLFEHVNVIFQNENSFAVLS